MSGPGGDLVLPPCPGMPDGTVVPAAELVERFSRSSGPGGQGVNTTDSKVELRFEPAASSAFSTEQLDRLLPALRSRLVDGQVLVVASEHRSQRRNRVAARERLVRILREALAPPPPRRRRTRPTHASHRRRLDAKRRRSQVKSGRGLVKPE